MDKADVVLITQLEYVHISDPNHYQQNILLEDHLLQVALEKRGLVVKRVGWDDPVFDWATTKCAVFRATWDYFNRIEEFLEWLNRVNKLTTLINSYELVIWNLDKHYLQDLRQKGVNVPDTYFIEKGERRSLMDLFKESGWMKAVLKPAISGAARHTYVLEASNIKQHESIFDQLMARESMLLQRFQDSIMEEGEWTFVIIGGKYTHGVLKKVKSGDFRVQDDFGGTVHDYSASSKEIAFAEHVMSLVKPLPLYGRVDVVKDQNGNLAVQELELIEPELWFRNCPDAVERLADCLLTRLVDNDSLQDQK